MNNSATLVLVIAVIAAVIVLLAAVKLVTWRTQVKNGTYVHNKVDKILKRYGVIRNFKILRDFEIRANGESVKVEHALIGFFGIIFLTARGETADFYGERTSENWLMVKDETKRKRIPNPIAQNEKAMALARNVLGQNKIYKVPMEGLAVFSGREKKTNLYCADSTVIRLKALKGYLNKAKFDKDNNVDVDEVKRIFLESANNK